MFLPANDKTVMTPRAGIYSPVIYENDGRGVFQFDVYSRLLKDRIIFIGTEIDDLVANAIIAHLLYLQMEDGKKDIHLYINSPGGSITAGLAIYDTMQFLSCDVNTYCIGMAASMGAVLLCAGTKGKRSALPNSDIMIHQASGGARGTASDIERTVEFLYKLNRRTKGIIARHTGQPEEKVNLDCDRDYFMTAQEAKEYGLVDEVVSSKRELPALSEITKGKGE